jgi:hypothetical protein
MKPLCRRGHEFPRKTTWATIGGFASYVDLLICLELARDAVSASDNPQDPRTKSGSGPAQPDGAGVTVGEAHRHREGYSRRALLERWPGEALSPELGGDAQTESTML